jgi:ribosomal protein S18 acetylase RimI-like enzyme
MTITSRETDIAIGIMREAAQWLAETGKPLWKPEELTKKMLLEDITEEDIYIGRENDIPAAAMILRWHDPYFWPQIGPNQSGFIHKLSVRRAFAGRGLAAEMIAFAEAECQRRNIDWLRLDCAADRPKLSRLYEESGFIQADQRMMGRYNVAFFEKKL